MCGFFGAISLENNLTTENFFRGFDEIIHRGPDDAGIFIKGANNEFSSKNQIENFDFDRYLQLNLSTFKFCQELFLFRRLSIIDLSRNGHQPFLDKKNRFVMCFNGEIYNYLELRQDMENKGIIFETSSDSEVLFQGLINYGIDFLNKVNGMFAIVFYDRKEKILTLARDRFGIKPIYYLIQKGKIIFGSELKSFTKLDCYENKVNINELQSFINFHDVSNSSETVLKDIKQLNSGHYLTIKNLENVFHCKELNWYNKNYVRSKNNLNEAKEKFKHLLEDSVKLRWRSDVRTGVFLSGGLDSSTVSIISSKINQNINSLSFQSSLKDYDEYNYVKMIQNQYKNIKNKKFNFNSSDYIDNFEKVAYYQEHPFTSASIITEYLLYKEASKLGYKVMIDGHGADESLLGYDYLKYLYIIDSMKKFNFKPFFDFFINTLFKPDQNKYKKLIKLLIKRIVYKQNKFFIKYKPKNLDKFIKNLFFNSNLPWELTCVDRNSMSNGIENRSPFLDYRLVEFIFSLNLHLLINKNTSKYILRESFKEFLPHNLYKRTHKVGISEEELALNDKKSNDFFHYTNLNANKILPEEIIVNIDNKFNNNFSQKKVCISSLIHWKKALNVTF